LCCNNACVTGECCNDSDCTSPFVCVNNECQEPALIPICGDLTTQNLTDYIRYCRSSGECDLTRNYAFNSVDFTGFSIDSTDLLSSFTISKDDVYGCQTDKNCSDGFQGCETHCTSCTETDNCVQRIGVSGNRVNVLVDDVLAQYSVLVPDLYVTSNEYTAFKHVINWKTQVNTCSGLKTNERTDSYFSGTSTCQRYSGVADSDIPCLIQLHSM
jgi:hypothetical protein